MKTTGFFSIFLLIACYCQAQSAIEWQKTFGGSYFDEAHCIQQTNDGGYIAVGITASDDGDISGFHGSVDYWVIKTNAIGTLEWSKTYGGSAYDWPYAIRQSIDGGYIIVGFTQSEDGDVTGFHGDYDAWIVKTNTLGEIEWQKSLGGSGWDEAFSIDLTSDGGYVISGRSNSIDGDATNIGNGGLDIWVIKLSEVGVIQWQKKFGGSDEETGYCIRQTVDNGYIITGETKSNDGNVLGNNGNVDFWVLKLNSIGELEWQNALGGNGLDSGRDVYELNDGFLVCGFAASNNGDVTGHHGLFDLWIIKLDHSGNLVWQKTLGGTNSDWGYEISQSEDGSFLVIGSVKSNDGDVSGNKGLQVIWVVKIDPNGQLVWQKAIGGTKGEGGYSIKKTIDNGFILAGFAWSEDGDLTGQTIKGYSDFWIIKLAPESSATQEASYSQLEVFPNPASQSVYLNTPAAESSLRVRVSDLLGREHLQQNLDGFNALDVSALAPGTYLVSASGESGKRYLGRFYKG